MGAGPSHDGEFWSDQRYDTFWYVVSAVCAAAWLLYLV